MIEISTSILNMIKGKESETIFGLEKAKTDYFHIDVMDGKFVEKNRALYARRVLPGPHAYRGDGNHHRHYGDDDKDFDEGERPAHRGAAAAPSVVAAGPLGGVAADVVLSAELAVGTSGNDDDLLALALVLVLDAPRVVQRTVAAFDYGTVVAGCVDEGLEVGGVLPLLDVVGNDGGLEVVHAHFRRLDLVVLEDPRNAHRGDGSEDADDRDRDEDFDKREACAHGGYDLSLFLSLHDVSCFRIL